MHATPWQAQAERAMGAQLLQHEQLLCGQWLNIMRLAVMPATTLTSLQLDWRTEDI